MTVTKNSISDPAGVLNLRGDKSYLLILINVLTFHAYKKKLPLFCLLFVEVCLSVIDFFSEKLIKNSF